MTKYFIEPFATAGDKVEIPTPLQSSGSVSYNQGFGYDYQRNLASDPLAKSFPRQGFNGLMNDVTSAIKQYQENGFFEFITPEMNGGKSFAYALAACVRFDMSDAKDGSDIRIFCSRIANNETNPKEHPDNWIDLSNSGIEFASNEETQAGIINDKAVSPAGLASLTATTARRGLVQLATHEEMVNGTNTTKAVTPSGLIQFINNRTAVIYPNGDENNPPTITTNQRITIANPFNTQSCIAIVEYLITDTSGVSLWAEPAALTGATVNSSTYSSNVKAYIVNTDTIVIMTGRINVLFRDADVPNPWKNPSHLTSAKYRVRVIKLGD